MQCRQCNGEFTPKNPRAVYCSNGCRQKAFQNRINGAIDEPINEPNDRGNANMITEETLERILSEREARHKAEIEKVRAELKLEALETRLRKLEEREEEEEPEQTLAGFKISDIMAAYQMYQQTQNQAK